MKPETTLKDLLKPPFKAIDFPGGRYIADSNGRPICKLLCTNEFLMHYDIVNVVEEFNVHALNEGWQKHFGEPLRWIRLEKRKESRHPCPAPVCQRR